MQRKTPNRVIAQRIKVARELAGLTQKTAAQRLFISPMCLSMKERAMTKIRADEIVAMAQLYEVDEEFLLGVKNVVEVRG